MSPIKAILMMCVLATTAFAGNVRFHNNCGYDVSLERSGVVVWTGHPHFQCGWEDALDIAEGKTKQVSTWGASSFVSGVHDAFDGSGISLPKMTFSQIKNKMVQTRKENGIPEPGRSEGAMLECTAKDQSSYFFNVATVHDVYLCA
jgi:hypothetical protein